MKSRDLPKVDREQFHWDSKSGKFLAEASDLDFPPGYWPLFFEVDTKIGTVIFGRRDATYSDLQAKSRDNELIGYDYFTEEGDHQMTVLND